MSDIPVIVSGDDEDIIVTLKKDDATFFISDVAATISAAIVSIDKSVQYISDTPVSPGVSGDDWSNSKIIVEFTEAQTMGLTPGPALLEVQVEDQNSKKKTWFYNVKITGDTIT